MSCFEATKVIADMDIGAGIQYPTVSYVVVVDSEY